MMRALFVLSVSGALVPGCADVLGANFDRGAADAAVTGPGADGTGLDEADANERDAASDAARKGRDGAPANDASDCATCTQSSDDGGDTCCADAGTTPGCTLRNFYEDKDGDGYGTNVSVKACMRPTGFADVSGDCNDGNAAVHPNVTVRSGVPYAVTGSSATSFDYDCNGLEEPVRIIVPCDRTASGSGNGVRCLAGGSGILCSDDSFYPPDGGVAVTKCGTDYFECNGLGGWIPQGPITCR